MRILVTDDEAPARARLVELLREIYGDGVQIFEAATGAEALELCHSREPDAVLMDIRMPVMSGLEAALHLTHMDNPPALIFTTAYDQYALAAFDRNAIDYLLKPVRKARLQQALEKAQRWTQRQSQSLSELGERSPRSHVCAYLRGDMQLIPVHDIIYFRADNKYVEARYPEGEILLEDSLKHLEQEFAGQFLRIHRNALVSVKEVAGLEKNRAGQAYIRLKSLDARLEISRRHLPEIRKWLKRGNP